jgi:hypothetical protein
LYDEDANGDPGSVGYWHKFVVYPPEGLLKSETTFKENSNQIAALSEKVPTFFAILQ